ncbi:multidrug ABC transporter [Alicyclobacillus sacchari]|uniref:efflux RND transporter permease subunit n=1 Tax=Alicyclobacillus sacchari TaxID=392010 RepID=UPI0023EA38C8|nr:efflux RND transporter permease subunit [Alicyclobacillus sacchari]GMA57612.1 multidrug ABC transporter [Alicyclobacillus sacchari]
MRIANFSIRRPVTITMLMVAIVLVGVFSMFHLPEELYPKLNLPIAAVATSWTGASPEEVEQQVSHPIEQTLEGLSGVQLIESTSTQGSSLVVVEFNYGTNIDEELNQMRSLIARVEPGLPADASAPAVEQFDPSSLPMMKLSVYGTGHVSQQVVSDAATNIVEPTIERLNGVAGVQTAGNLTRQITVDVDPAKLAKYHLSIEQVVQAIASDNMSADAGQVQKGNLLIPLHVDGQFASPSDVNNVPIALPLGGNIPLRDIATVEDGDKTVTLMSTVNGKSAVTLSVSQASDANIVQVSNAVRQEIPSLASQLPAGVHVQILSDSAQPIRDTMDTVVNHTVLGFIFGVIVILLILRSIRTTAVVAVAIPIATLSTFALMAAAGLSINSITLGSLAVGLGSLVDFSIVVLESIFRARQRGLSAREAAKLGTEEVGMAVVVAACAQICVFAPSIFVPGLAGQFFKPLSLTVSFSHVAALFVALTFTPMLASRLLRGRRFERPDTVPGIDAPFRLYAPFDWSARIMHGLTSTYRAALRWALGHRNTVFVVTTLMFVASIAMVPKIGFELVPNVGDNQMSVSIDAPQGTSLAATNAIAQQVEAMAREKLSGIQQIDAQIGGNSYSDLGATNQANITVSFAASVASKEVDAMSHQFGIDVQQVKGAQIQVAAGSANGSSGPASNQISVQIQGADMAELVRLSHQVVHLMQQTKGLEDIQNGATSGVPDVQLTLSQSALALYGLTEQEVESVLRTDVNGAVASTFNQGGNAYDIVVQLPSSYAQNLNNLSKLTVENQRGEQVPVTKLGSVSDSSEPPQIDHVNGERTITVTATPYGVTSGRAQAALAKKLKTLHVPNGYSVGFGQNGQFLHSTMIDLAAAFAFSILLLYMLMASLFEALLTPFVIMFCLPPTFIGAALGLFLTHRSLNIDSAIGVIMVMGLIANNAIVLVDYTNRLRREGYSLYDALMQAGPVRLRPILMSTLTTVLAMMPLVIGYGKGAATLASMATVIAFGLTFSTLVTLLLVPAVYLTFAGKRDRRQREQNAGLHQGADGEPPVELV